jgi:MOSC domain-containing protein YiiM
MALVGKEFMIGGVRMRGVKYCDPCDRPDKLSKKIGFRERFSDRGGLIAEIINDGIIRLGDLVVPPPKGY